MDRVNTVTKGNRDSSQMESDAASTWSSQIHDDSRGELCSLYYKEAVELVKLAGPAVSVNIKILSVELSV